MHGFEHAQERYARPAAQTYWVSQDGFSGGNDRANLIPTLVLRFSAITGESKSETQCPTQFTREVNPRTPTLDTRGKP